MKALLLALSAALMASAQAPDDWIRQNPKTNPPPRYLHSMAYDSAHSQVVLYGGQGNPFLMGDTWVWDGFNWTQKFPQTIPVGARSQSAMAYDSAHGQVVLFSGWFGSSVVLNDTWTWDGSNWSQQLPKNRPKARLLHSMAYDPDHHEVVLFGGQEPSGGQNGPPLLNDTWVWDGANWTQRTPETSPSPRCGHAMAYDPAHNQLVLFGGTGSSSIGSLNDTWVWDGSNWSQKFPQMTPPAVGQEMAYDSALAQIVLFGNGGLWLWDGSNWKQQFPQIAPPPRSGGAIAYDSAHDQVFLFGGEPPTITSSDEYYSDTWTWSGGALSTTSPTVANVITASAFGGFNSVSPGSWIEIYGSNLAAHTRQWTGADFSGNDAPLSLDGVSVTVGAQSAFVGYISPNQVNAQLPFNVATSGSPQLTVTNRKVISEPYNVGFNSTQPGLLAPASFRIGMQQYVVALLPDGSYVLPSGATKAVSSRPAKPGETIVMYGLGFGEVSPATPAGEVVQGTSRLIAPLQIKFGVTQAQVAYAGLAPGFVGLYQFNVVVPNVPDCDDVQLTLSLNDVQSPQVLFTSVHQ